jgi:succinate dehydrogenase subunit D
MSVAAGRSKGHRADVLWVAALAHRVSGLLLALFLPVHFLVLGLAIEGSARFENLLRWTDLGIVKLAEAVLVLLLAVHLLGGVRILVIENFSWRQNHRCVVLLVAAAATALAGLFLIGAW